MMDAVSSVTYRHQGYPVLSHIQSLQGGRSFPVVEVIEDDDMDSHRKGSKPNGISSKTLDVSETSKDRSDMTAAESFDRSCEKETAMKKNSSTVGGEAQRQPLQVVSSRFPSEISTTGRKKGKTYGEMSAEMMERTYFRNVAAAPWGYRENPQSWRVRSAKLHQIRALYIREYNDCVNQQMLMQAADVAAKRAKVDRTRYRMKEDRANVGVDLVEEMPCKVVLVEEESDKNNENIVNVKVVRGNAENDVDKRSDINTSAVLSSNVVGDTVEAQSISERQPKCPCQKTPTTDQNDSSSSLVGKNRPGRPFDSYSDFRKRIYFGRGVETQAPGYSYTTQTDRRPHHVHYFKPVYGNPNAFYDILSGPQIGYFYKKSHGNRYNLTNNGIRNTVSEGQVLSKTRDTANSSGNLPCSSCHEAKCVYNLISTPAEPCTKNENIVHNYSEPRGLPQDNQMRDLQNKTSDYKTARETSTKIFLPLVDQLNSGPMTGMKKEKIINGHPNAVHFTPKKYDITRKLSPSSNSLSPNSCIDFSIDSAGQFSR